MAETSKTPDIDSSSRTLDKDDVIKFLGDEDDETIPLKDDKVPDKKEKVKKEAEPDEVIEPKDDEKEIEKELEKPDEKKLELLTPVSKTVVLKKYPDLFKDFPDLETAVHREQAFTERFPTIKDADNALEDSKTIELFESDLLNGNTEKMLLATKQADPEAFKRIVDNYLVTLGQVDKEAYHHVIGNTIRHTVISMLNEAKSSSDDELSKAAQVLNYFMFGTSKIESPTNLANPKAKDTEESRLTNERKERFQTVSDDLDNKVKGSIRKTIEANIDPKNEMRDYDKRNATRDAIEELESTIEKDTRFRVIVDRLWKEAAKSNFNKESIDKIQSAFFTKVKGLLPAIISKARKEATNGKKLESKDDSKKEKVTKEPRRPTREDTEIKVPKGMSTLEYLNMGD